LLWGYTRTQGDPELQIPGTFDFGCPATTDELVLFRKHWTIQLGLLFMR